MSRTKFLTLLLALAWATATWAVPAWPVRTTITLADGTTTTAQLMGDERMHYYVTDDGRTLLPTATGLQQTTKVRLSQLRTERMQQSTLSRAGHLGPRRMKGSKKSPVILVEFTDRRFSRDSATTVQFFDEMLNGIAFNYQGSPGSVRQYFADMSRNQFYLTFDLIGPIRVSESSTAYGGSGGTDYVGELFSQVLHKTDSIYHPDWGKYDWDGDGQVEQVYFLYAGYGAATGGARGTVWPHAWTLEDAQKEGSGGDGKITFGNVSVNQYACGNELSGSIGKTLMGHGLFCHEFSHCLGLPDMYDIMGRGNQNMGAWDLMASGSYNGPQGLGWCPPAWTAYERVYAGWMEFTELIEPQTIKDMTDLTDPQAKAYAIYNDGNRNEYYFLENHQHYSWDAYTPETGLLIVHVDYDSTLFANNIVNTTGSFSTEEGFGGNFTNDHPRMIPISKTRSVRGGSFYTFPMIGTNLALDSLTDDSGYLPATLYNPNTDGSKLMHKPLYDISIDEETGLATFGFMQHIESAAIADLNSDSISLPLRYYDLQGRPLAARPSAGFYIEIDTTGRAYKRLAQ